MYPQVDWVKRVEDSEARAQRNYEKAEESELERQKELADIGEADTDLGTKVGSGGLGLDPVRAALFPIQLMLGLAVKVVRFTKNVITWQEGKLYQTLIAVRRLSVLQLQYSRNDYSKETCYRETCTRARLSLVTLCARVCVFYYAR